MAQSSTRLRRSQVAAVRRFLQLHGTPARAVVDPVGRAGVRVSLIAVNGRLGDIFLPSKEAIDGLFAEFSELEQTTWTPELSNAVVITPAQRRRMTNTMS